MDVVGWTPLVRLNRVVPAGGARVLAKMESLNPGGSVKDRIALAMVEAAERDGRLKPGATIVEPTSGNTGIGLAMVAAARGYRLILTMPEDMSLERRHLLARFGAELILTPAIEGMSGAVFAAQELLRPAPALLHAAAVRQPGQPGRARAHHGPRDPGQTGGEVDAFVAGVGTGGTITGVGRVLKRELPRSASSRSSRPLAGPEGRAVRVRTPSRASARASCRRCSIGRVLDRRRGGGGSRGNGDDRAACP